MQNQDSSALEQWASDALAHDPLCATQFLPAAGCFGCLLVRLRSDATYEDDPDARTSALDALAEIVELAQAHLDHALSVSPR